MATRSLTFLKNEEGKTILGLYRHMDGYPSGHGMDLVNFLEPITIVNGIGYNNNNAKIANGSGCLAAQMVSHFKKDVGGFYIYPPNTKDAGQDYSYVITIPSVFEEPFEIDRYKIVVKGFQNRTIFKGNFTEFKKFCQDNDNWYDS